MQPPPPATNGPVIAGYFTNWSIYARNYNVIDVAASAHKLTHILYAFANLQEDGTVVLGDVWADKDKHFPPEQTINHQADSWNEQGNNLYGNFKQLYLLKQKHRHLKVTLSIGGWTWSTNFSAVASDPQKRARFIDTAIKHLNDLGLDGLDIDWEYPKDDKDAFFYVHLLYELRIALDRYQQRLQQTDQPRLLLTVAVPCGPSHYRTLRLQQMEPYVDLFYLMAYDFAGSWDSKTGHQSALYGGSLNGHQAVSDYLAAGIPPHKIVMGLPLYGRAFSNTSGPDASFQGLPEGSWEQGMFDYKALPKPGATENHDWQRLASWSYDPQAREFVTYDTPEIVRGKCDYIRKASLGGAMFWELSADQAHDHPRSLLNCVYDAFNHHLDTMPNHLSYPESQYDNVKRGMA
ncbi:chitinase [Radiomyces spectabilis]|uniref:chitinase n=1 Tax=Radiomyces spectabilis TaxID=64574 RepID=UPI00221E65FE|nr:chitinase [Radiomyces spectabilis]KAI8366830.1 chitinase [Radiomyces spectabilis]